MTLALAEPVLTRPAGLPEFSLAPQALAWSYDYLLQPDGPAAGQPWEWTDEQVDFLYWWYGIDEFGRWIYPRAVLERMKGWGKDPVGAGISGVEMVGPCRFAGWSRSGQPIAAPHSAAWVQIAAVSKDQTRNTMTLFPAMFSPRAVREFGLDIGKEIIYAKKTNGRLEAVTSSPRALEGGRSTFVLRNETHHWLSSNDGHAMAKVTSRNIAKARGGGARMLDITNAHEPGEDSVAEREWDAWQKIQAGLSKGSGLLYDSREAPPGTVLTDEASLRAGIEAARGDSTWLDVAGLMQVIYSPSTSVSESRRFYLNQKVAPEDAWVVPQDWETQALPEKIAADEPVVMFFDGSKSDDATGLVAVRISDGKVFQLGVWQKPTGWDDQRGLNRWIVDRAAVNLAVEAAFEDLAVKAFWADPSDSRDDSGERYWEALIDAWHRRYKGRLRLWAVKTGDRQHSIAWDMRSPEHVKLFTQAAERFLSDVEGGTVPHDGAVALATHIKNARRRPNQYGVSIGKEHRESARKIDLAVCAVGARMLWRLLQNKKSTGGGGRVLLME